MKRYSVAVVGWTLWDGIGTTPTGAAVVSYELTQRLSHFFNCDMIFITSDRKKIGKIKKTQAGFTKRYILRKKAFRHFDNNFLKDYDLIHIWDSTPIFTYRAFTRDFIPHCHTLHSVTSMIDWFRLASSFYVKNYDMITLGSECLKDSLNKLWNVPAYVIPYGVDTNLFKPLDKYECRKSLGLPVDSIILGYLGRLSKFDPFMAYDTLRQIKKRSNHKNIILVVSGGRKKTKPVIVKDDFIYLGYLQRIQIPKFLNSCDIFFNPVAGICEGFGLTIIEAMSCGLPILSTSWNGYSETIPKDLGFMTARTCWKNGEVWINQKDLVSTGIELVKNEILREKICKKVRLIAEKRYQWNKCVLTYRNKLTNLISKGSPKELPYKYSPEKIFIKTRKKNHIITFDKTFKNEEKLRVDFDNLYKGFVSDFHLKGLGWKKFVCIDNIVNLPRYRGNMKNALDCFGVKMYEKFPKLVNSLKF